MTRSHRDTALIGRYKTVLRHLLRQWGSRLPTRDGLRPRPGCRQGKICKTDQSTHTSPGLADTTIRHIEAESRVADETMLTYPFFPSNLKAVYTAVRRRVHALLFDGGDVAEMGRPKDLQCHHVCDLATRSGEGAIPVLFSTHSQEAGVQQLDKVRDSVSCRACFIRPLKSKTGAPL